VALTAYAMQGDEQKALEAGCDGYLAKPIDTRLLAATVERYLAQA
jgi:CheY-like chemotaxis protein